MLACSTGALGFDLKFGMAAVVAVEGLELVRKFHSLPVFVV